MLGVSSGLRIDETVATARVIVLIDPVVSRPQLQQLRRSGSTRPLSCVVVTDRLRSSDLLVAVSLGVVAVLPRSTLQPQKLVAAVWSAASGRGTLPPELTGVLLAHLRRIEADLLAPRGLGLSGLSKRERATLALLGEGLSTEQVAARLDSSARVVKRDLTAVMQRLHLRTRTEAVAYAVRSGAI